LFKNAVKGRSQWQRIECSHGHVLWGKLCLSQSSACDVDEIEGLKQSLIDEDRKRVEP
jgi:hypothetical protein